MSAADVHAWIAEVTRTMEDEYGYSPLRDGTFESDIAVAVDAIARGETPQDWANRFAEQYDLIPKTPRRQS